MAYSDEPGLPTRRIDAAWRALPEAASSAPSAAGLYWIALWYPVSYGHSASPIVYIGMSRNLRQRLQAHAGSADARNIVLEGFSGSQKERLLAAFLVTRDLDGARLGALEGEAMCAFGIRHGYIPYANRLPFDPSPASLEGPAYEAPYRPVVSEPSVEGSPVRVEDLAAEVGLIPDLDPCPVAWTRDDAGNELAIYSMNFRIDFSLDSRIRRQRRGRGGRRRARRDVQEQPYDSNLAIPEDPVARNTEGRRLEKAGYVDNAIELYERNVALGVDTPFPYKRLAILYRKRRRPQAERAVLDKAVALFPNKPWFADRLATNHDQ